MSVSLLSYWFLSIINFSLVAKSTYGYVSAVFVSVFPVGVLHGQNS